MRWFKRALLVLLGLGVVAAIVVASLPKPVDVDTAQVARGALRVTVDAEGRTRVRDRYVIGAPLYGNLGRIELDPGDDVMVGDVLVRVTPLEPALLDPRARGELEARVRRAEAAPRPAKAAVERARETADFANDQLERNRDLHRAGALPRVTLDESELEARRAQSTLESARFGVRVARHEVEMAQAALGRVQKKGEPESMQVTAPVEGRVLRIFRESEGVVNAGEALIELGEPHALEVVVDVLTPDAVEIHPGDPVTMTRWGGPVTLQGRVRRVEPSAFTKVSALGVEEQRVNVIIDLADDYEVWSRLGDNYRVETAIEIWRGDDVILVPAGALHRRGPAWAVFVLEDDRAVERVVEVGRRSGLAVQVLAGLEPGETIIVHPSDRVGDGVRVRPRHRDPDPPTAIHAASSPGEG
jgi:HlyD family secretion protein